MRLRLLALGLALFGTAAAAQPLSAPAPTPTRPLARRAAADLLARPFPRPTAAMAAGAGRPIGASGTGPEWARLYGTGYAGTAARTVATAVASDGTTYTLGEAVQPGGGPGVTLARHSATGTEAWRVWFDAEPGAALAASALVLDALGRPVVIAADERLEGDAVRRDVLVRRYAPDGTVDWTARYGEAGRVVMVSAAAAGADGTYVVGATYGTPDASEPDPFALRVTTEGAVAWTSEPEGGSTGETPTWQPGFFDVAALPGGGMVAVGASSDQGPVARGSGGTTPHFIVYRYTADGVATMSRHMQPTGTGATATAVTVDDEGTAYAAGFAENELGGHTPLLGRFDAGNNPTMWAGTPSPNTHIPSELRYDNEAA